MPTCPVVAEISSTVPAGRGFALGAEQAEERPGLRDHLPAVTLLTRTDQQGRRQLLGLQTQDSAAFTVRMIPGSSVRATTVSGATASPARTTTSPFNGSRRVRRISVSALTVSPGV